MGFLHVIERKEQVDIIDLSENEVGAFSLI